MNQPLLGGDDVHDALSRVTEVEVADPVLGRVGAQRGNHLGATGHGGIGAARFGGDDVIGHGEGALGVAHPPTGHAQAGKRLRTGQLVHQVAVNVDQAAPIGQLGHVVCVPQLVEQGPWRRRG